jgi:hypothetical protein
MTNKTRKWIRSGFEVLIHGGTSAIVSTIAAAQVDPKSFALFSPGFWALAKASFVFSGALRFFQWWNNNPLPPDETDPPFLVDQPKISINPMSKVQPMAKEDPPT